MTAIELKRRLRHILSEETIANPDWNSIAKLCSDLSREMMPPAADASPHIIHHFLADFDIRHRDPEYAEMQYNEVRNYVEIQVLD